MSMSMSIPKMDTFYKQKREIEEQIEELNCCRSNLKEKQSRSAEKKGVVGEEREGGGNVECINRSNEEIAAKERRKKKAKRKEI